MTTHNTSFDAANTAVRAYLTTLGEKYLGHRFDTGSGEGKKIWLEIQERFDNRCAYCDEKVNRPTREHLDSFNKDTGGLHHPGNIVPCCSGCNRRRKVDGKEIDWKTHLADVVERNGHSITTLRERQDRIEKHIKDFEHPKLSDDEMAAIRTIAQSLYEAVSREVIRGTELYWAIHESMINKSKP